MKLGIDIGGSHIGLGIISEENQLIQSNHIDFDKKRNGVEEQEIKEILKQNIQMLLDQTKSSIEQIEKIGVAAPGVPKKDKIERIVNLKLEEVSIYDLLPEELKDKKILIHNDGKCSAMAEKKLGSLQEEKDAIFLCLGTGIGAGVFLDGKLLKPKKVPGFEIGHMIIKEDGLLCRCRKSRMF